MSEQTKKFAVFDIDGTIFRSSLFVEVAYELLSSGGLDKSILTESQQKNSTWLRREHDSAYEDFAHSISVTMAQTLPKIRVADYDAAVKRVISNKLAHTYVYTRDLSRKLKKEGYFLIAISGSQYEIVESFASQYGFDDWVGQKWERGNEYFTGNATYTFDHKGNTLRKLVDEHHLTFSGSYAIGDTESDGEMLEMVEHPIAFNPNKRLFDVASKHGWDIVIERKNVHYKLEKGNHGSYILAYPKTT